MQNVHDNLIYQCVMDLENQSICLRTRSYSRLNDGKTYDKIDILFDAVLCHQLEDFGLQNVLFDIESYPFSEFEEDHPEWEIDGSIVKWHEAMFLEPYTKDYQYYSIDSSFNLDGFIIAKKMMVTVVEKDLT
ncbi:hypothetical protein [Isobaculum melis]|uniref:hypothetical protein n=1 Tax=Isobaculum melis TaxID=142588 RepID=UPI000B887E73|nr:hypothetical protein [Isobaculum melis]